MRSQALEKTAHRIVWVRLAGLVFALLLAARAAHLTIDHARAVQLATQQMQTEQRLAPARGTIVDRDGRELAVTIEGFSVFALPHLIDDHDAAARVLARALGLDATRVAERLAAHDRFTYVARWVDPAAAERVLELELAGVGVDREPRRSYPAGSLAATLIGFADIDGKGVRGVEQLEDTWLAGRPRRVRVERDARGRTLALQSTDPREVQGGEIALTLDAAMQGAAEAALEEAVATSRARGGLVVTLDPRTGDLLTLAEAPGFDPNRFREVPYAETRSRAFTDVVEAGSTMKVFLVASALDAGAIDPREIFETEEGWLRVPGKTIRDRKPFGAMTPADVLRVSSNVGAVQIAQRLGRESQHRGLLRFGFGASTGSGYPTESAGLVRDWADWKPVDQATISFGQGLSVTAIQLASALAALANDGERMQPRIVHARRRPAGVWQPTEIRSRGLAVSPETARLTLDMMQTVVSHDGTGRLAGLDGVPVAGKTGTAQKLDRELGRYSQDRYVAWFMGAVPADDPELVIVVAVDEPAGALHSGGGLAAPLFARVAAAQLGLRGIDTEPRPVPAPPPAPTLLVEGATEAIAPDAIGTDRRPWPGEGSAVARRSPTEASPVAGRPWTGDEDAARADRVDGDGDAPKGRAQRAVALTSIDLADLADLEDTSPEEYDPIDTPPRADVAAPPARPAAVEAAAGPPPSRTSQASATRAVAQLPVHTPKPAPRPAPRVPATPPPVAAAPVAARPVAVTPAPRPARPSTLASEPVFVPDFSGQTISNAMRIAAREALEISTAGAIEGRVVSQSPVPGTVLDGPDRTVRLRFAPPPREEG
ncbi:MAG: PASTA domain-containing protein [Spirochaetaceae bacterium]|nr:PASTA domain-containing protein [Spirochaetaceae bacterium]